jgi:hypothetical protein
MASDRDLVHLIGNQHNGVQLERVQLQPVSHRLTRS